MSPPTVAGATRALAAFPRRGVRCVVGFDGFVDEIASVVSPRTWPRGGDYQAVATLADMGAIVAGASGKSPGREIVVRATGAGGNAPNFADGLMALEMGERG